MCLVEKVPVSDISGWVNVCWECHWSEKFLSGKYLLGKCPLGMCLVEEMSFGKVSVRIAFGQGNVLRESFRRGNVLRGSGLLKSDLLLYF